MYELRRVDELIPDATNPRKPDANRLHLLSISLLKLGFLIPIAITKDGLVLSGHQRLTVAKQLGYDRVPVQTVSIPAKNIAGVNILFNRVTNDFGALDTGSGVLAGISLTDIVQQAEALPDLTDQEKYAAATGCKEESIIGWGEAYAAQYDKKAIIVASNFIRLGIKIPIIAVAPSAAEIHTGRKRRRRAVGRDATRSPTRTSFSPPNQTPTVVNGVHRLLAALEAGYTEWPVIYIPEHLATFAKHFLNYLSMDFHVDDDFANVLRFSAYRRPQNNRGNVPKAYRFWANGCRTLADRDSYSVGYWRKFREMHGLTVVDFGSGLSTVAPFLQGKGIDCIDFEPYRIDPDAEAKKPDPAYSRKKATEFLARVSDKETSIDSIFLASVLNSVPFPKDRMSVLAIVHSLCSFSSTVYGTCRDISDFTYEYGGVRQANYFVFDSEPGVRLGDTVSNPKIQKFHTQEEMKKLLGVFWAKVETWPGGNVFYWKASAPRRCNPRVLRQALAFEFNLPYADGSTMGLVEEACTAFGSRVGHKV